jgi:phospho-N-acetylmuramoyl-pentapeptide-transferase
VVTVSLKKKLRTPPIPFFKNNEFDYAELLARTGEGYEVGLGDFIPVVILLSLLSQTVLI